MVSVNLRPGEGRKAGASRRRRPRTLGLRRLTRERRQRGAGDDLIDVDVDVDGDGDDLIIPVDEGDPDDVLVQIGGRPVTRRECRSGPRPCPWVSCRHHLAVDVSEYGALKLNFPDRALGELPATCALDVAERGGLSLEEVGGLLNVTRERARQIEAAALRKILRAIMQR
jgi:hypothetical protein